MFSSTQNRFRFFLLKKIYTSSPSIIRMPSFSSSSFSSIVALNLSNLSKYSISVVGVKQTKQDNFSDEDDGIRNILALNYSGNENPTSAKDVPLEKWMACLPAVLAARINLPSIFLRATIAIINITVNKIHIMIC